MGNLTIALVFVLTINIFFFLAQAAILDLNPDAPIFFTNKGTILDQLDVESGTSVLDTDNTLNNLPTGEGSVSPTTGNFFTDMFSSIKNWFVEATGLGYLLSIISAPYNFLKMALSGLGESINPLIFAIGTLWYGVTLFLVIAFFWGRST